MQNVLFGLNCIGQFGMVYKGHLINHQYLNVTCTQDVAVKILKSICECTVMFVVEAVW